MSDIDTLSIPARTHGRVLVRRRDPSAGVLVGFHGYAEHAAEQLARLAEVPGCERWTLVAIQGLHRFYRRRTGETVASWMTREDRLLTIPDNVAYVDAALDSVLDEPVATLVYAGFSQGVAMAFRAAVRGRRAPRGVIAVGGDIPPELLADPGARFPDALLVRGESDEWYTTQKHDGDASALRARGIAVQTRTAAGVHAWTTEVSQVVGEWVGGL
jgi:predicted esterase